MIQAPGVLERPSFWQEWLQKPKFDQQAKL